MKPPKVYVRDSGIAHALLGIRDKEALLGHPVAGQTWESFVIETLIAAAPQGSEAHFYRTSAGATQMYLPACSSGFNPIGPSAALRASRAFDALRSGGVLQVQGASARGSRAHYP